jgi:hypothetical protein
MDYLVATFGVLKRTSSGEGKATDYTRGESQ